MRLYQRPALRRQDTKPEIVKETPKRQEDIDDYYKDEKSLGPIVFFIVLVLAFLAIIVLWMS